MVSNAKINEKLVEKRKNYHLLSNTLNRFNLNNYILISLAVFIVLLVTFAYLLLNKVTSGFLNVISVLMGSSITAVLTLSLESFKLKKKNKELELAIFSEIKYNKLILEKILEPLQEEIKALLKLLESGSNEKIEIKFPMPIIKTDLWNIIKFHIDIKSLGENYESLIIVISNIDYINSHLRQRDGHVKNNSGSTNYMETLMEIDKTIVKNTEELLKFLDQLPQYIST